VKSKKHNAGVSPRANARSRDGIEGSVLEKGKKRKKRKKRKMRKKRGRRGSLRWKHREEEVYACRVFHDHDPKGREITRRFCHRRMGS
jgi:hypothetical protein